jgi:hypothetical protein
MVGANYHPREKETAHGTLTTSAVLAEKPLNPMPRIIHTNAAVNLL